jgi:hypothetical protein
MIWKGNVQLSIIYFDCISQGPGRMVSRASGSNTLTAEGVRNQAQQTRSKAFHCTRTLPTPTPNRPLMTFELADPLSQLAMHVANAARITHPTREKEVSRVLRCPETFLNPSCSFFGKKNAWGRFFFSLSHFTAMGRRKSTSKSDHPWTIGEKNQRLLTLNHFEHPGTNCLWHMSDPIRLSRCSLWKSGGWITGSARGGDHDSF